MNNHRRLPTVCFPIIFKSAYLYNEQPSAAPTIYFPIIFNSAYLYNEEPSASPDSLFSDNFQVGISV